MTPRLNTIGHSNHAIETFVALLRRGIETVHLLADGRREMQAETAARAARRKPQARLFD